MTNAEKFEEVFGYPVTKQNPEDPCDIVSSDICMNYSCSKCPIKNFWNKLYRSPKKER